MALLDWAELVSLPGFEEEALLSEEELALLADPLEEADEAE